MPSVQSFQLDADLIPHSLEIISMDITATYGSSGVPDIEDVPFYTMKYADFGIDDITPQGIVDGYHRLEQSSWENQEKFLAAKIGYSGKSLIE